MAGPLSVLLLGHSYMAEENRKQLDALGQFGKVDVLSPSSWHEGMTQYDFQPGVVEGINWRIHFLKERRLPGLPQSQYLLPGLKQRLTSLRPQLIHIESDPWTTFALQMIDARNRLDRSVPLVCTAKQNTYTKRGGVKDGLKRGMAQWGIRNIARFIGVTPAVQEIYHEQFGLNPARFDVNTHLGVDTDLFCPVDESGVAVTRKRWVGDEAEQALLIGYCGRLEAYKGITDLVTAVETLRQQTDRDIRLMALGSGPLQGDMKEKAEASCWITIHGRVPHAQVADFMKALDLFVMPARKSPLHEEHDAHAVIEALSCGLPCIGSDSGAIPGVLKDAGWIYPAGDQEKLARTIRDFTEEFFGERQRQANETGRKKVVEEYSLQAVAKKNWLSYQRAMER